MQNRLLLLCFLFGGTSIIAQDCFFEFKYKRNIQLASVSGTLEAGTIAIPFNTKELVDAGKLAPDGSDLRVVNEACEPLPFFVQGLADRDANVLYVKTPEFTTSGITIQLYYGGDGSQSSVIDGLATFDFFDDFEDGVIDDTKWEPVGQHSLYAEVDGELRFTGVFGNGGIFQYAAPRVGYTGPVTFDFAANANNSQVYGIGDTADLQRVGLRYDSGAQSYDTLDIIALMSDTLSGGFNPGLMYPFIQVPRNDLNIMSVSGFIDANKHLNFTRTTNYSTGSENLDTLTITQMEFDALRPFFSSFSTPIKIEYVGIRAALSADPVITFGDEMMVITDALSNVIEVPGLSVFPNPANKSINIKCDRQLPAELTLFDSFGRKIRHYLVTDQTIDVSDLPPGSYLLQMQFDEGLAVRKLQIVR